MRSVWLDLLVRRGAAAVCCLFVFVVGDVRPAGAVLRGSVHDFVNGPSSNLLPKNGPCSACHGPHPGTTFGLYGRIWARSLSEEMLYYNPAASPAPIPYLPGGTLYCYDCHDDATTVDNSPDRGVWNSGHAPQDIALGTILSQPPPNNFTGYYELVNGTRPNPPPLLPTLGTPTGGHFWRTEPGQLPDYKRGDKLACAICHEPHNIDTSGNEVFFRRYIWSGTARVDIGVTNQKKSPNSRNGTGTGREMCVACHGYASIIPLLKLYDVWVPPPSTNIPEHYYGVTMTTPCTNCHPHNRPVGCNECHGYPPMLTAAEGGGAFDPLHSTRKFVENYPGGAGAHRRHKDALAALGTSIFNCEICHGPKAGMIDNADHMQSADGFTVLQTNVDLKGQTSFWGSGSSYNGTSTGAAGQYAFAAKGAAGPYPDQRCSNLICHGRPPLNEGSVFLNWGDRMVDAGGNILGDGLSICKWCHDKTPARIDTGPWAPNVLGNNDGIAPTPGLWNTGSWGADVSGHGKALGAYDAAAIGDAAGKNAAAKECAFCHDASYTDLALPATNTATRTHLNGSYETSGSEKRLRGTINGLPVATPDAACVVCHQNGLTGTAVEGTDVSTHGNNFLGNAEGAQGSMTRACRQCHEVHGSNYNGSGRNLRMLGHWLDSTTAGVRGLADGLEGAYIDSSSLNATTDFTIAADLQIILTSRGSPTTPVSSLTADNSWDDGFNDNLHDSLCVVCHRAAEMNSEYHLDQNTVESTTMQGSGHNPVGIKCLDCHSHDPDKNTLTADGFAPSGCSSCHGTSSTETLRADPNAGGAMSIAGQSWPDGAAVNSLYTYADNQTGAHRRHIEALSQQLFAESVTELVKDFSAGNITLTSAEKQKAICLFCHRDPGGPGHSIDVTTDPLGGRVNVYRDTDDSAGAAAVDVFRKLTLGAKASDRDLTGVNGDQAYDYTHDNCTNLVCHNKVTTPAAPSSGIAPGWQFPPVWTASATCATTTTCHGTGTYTNAHTAHVGTARKNYACTECHPDNVTVTAANPIPLGHGNGDVEMVFNVTAGIAPPPIEAAKGGNGFYDKSDTGGNNNVHDAGDDAFTYERDPATNKNKDCLNIYCHGGDNAGWGGGDITPVWDNSAPDSVYCGSCHDGNGTAPTAGDSSVIATGNHVAHLNGSWGPKWGNGGCAGTATTGCHTDFDTPTYTSTHVDGSVQFKNIAATPVYSPLGTLAVKPATATDTDRCSYCHSTAAVTVFNAGGVAIGPTSGTALVKTAANWADTAYESPCLTCHNGTDAGSTFANGTGQAAPNMLGTDVALPSPQYGAEIRGHGLTTGLYPISNNPAANKYCTVCHDKTAAHLNNSNDTTFAGNRLLSVIETYTLPAQTSSAVCESCHARTGSTATRKNVNQHSNNGYPPPTATTQGRLEAVFTLPECVQCHEPHGMTANGTGYNIYMVPGTITVVPGAAPVTVPNVRFEALTGNNSYNDTQGTPNNDLCVVCHITAPNPAMKNPGGDGQHKNIVPASVFYDSDDRGHNCTGCHTHNRDNVTGNLPANMDGFMPVACNSCHTFPGLADLGAPTHQNSSTHNIHTGDPVAGPVNKYKFPCWTCHYQNNHNETGMGVGDVWSVLNTTINIRFDPGRNGNGGGNPTYAGVNAFTQSAPGTTPVAGSGVCALLYCHGDGTNGTNGGNVAFPAGFKNAVIVPPHWNVAAEGNCGTCHKIAGSTPPVGTLAHPKHVEPIANGKYAIACQVCHYGTTTDGTSVPSAGMAVHVNGSVEISFDVAADSRSRVTSASSYNGDKVLGSGYGSCSSTYCHSRGTDMDPAGGFPDDAANPALAWNGTATCASCHGGVSSMPEYANNSPKANRHPKHVTANGYGCEICHYPTTHTNGSIYYGAANTHVNRSYDVNDDEANNPPQGTFDAFSYASGTPGTCSSVTCHGGQNGIAWDAATVACNTCHARSLGVTPTADANNFAGRDWIQSKVNEGTEYTSWGHGAKSAMGCAVCHDSTNTDHDQLMTGANPYRLGAGFTCTNTTSFNSTNCHTGASSSKVRSHTPADMQLGGYTNIRTWSWNPQCVNCHDPHGDGINKAMVQRELYDKAAFSLTAAPPAPPTEQTGLVFTDNTTGIAAGSYVWSTESTPNFSGICQECHERTGSGSLVSFHDGDPGTGTVAGSNHTSNTGDCSNCHQHEPGFAPMACEACHDTPPYPGIGGGTGDDAPVVMTWYNVNGHGTKNFDPDGSGGPLPSRAVACGDCHDTNSPSPTTHLTGRFETYSYPGSTWGSPNTNTAHMKAAYFGTVSNEKDWQVNFDNNCYKNIYCHKDPPTVGHRHETSHKDGVVRFGDNKTVANPKQVRPGSYWTPWTIDDISTEAPPPTKHYAPCIACHDPHGADYSGYTYCLDAPDGNYHMVKKNFCDKVYFCNSNCHKP